MVSAQATRGWPCPALAREVTRASPACTVSGATVFLHTGGTCTITAFQAGSFQPRTLQASGSGPGSRDFAYAPDVTRSIHVQDTQTITFAPPGSALAGVAVPLTATASSGLRVAFGSGTPEVCTVTGSTVTTLAPGTCTITATQGGDTDYAPAPDVTQSTSRRPR